MSNYSKLYWLTRLDNINDFFHILIAAGIILFFILGFYRLFSFLLENEYEKKPWIWFMTSSFLFLGVIGNVLTPTKNEAIFIIAGGKVMDFAQNDSSLNKIPEQATKMLSSWMDKEINKSENNIVSSENKK